MVLGVLALILVGLAKLGAIMFLEFIFIAWSVVVDWFVDRVFEVRNDPSLYAVTVADDISNGNVSYVQGIFDTDTEQFTEARRIKGRDADSRIRQAHAANKVAIWS